MHLGISLQKYFILINFFKTLTLGIHKYKFIVDGEWIVDPKDPIFYDKLFEI